MQMKLIAKLVWDRVGWKIVNCVCACDVHVMCM